MKVITPFLLRMLMLFALSLGSSTASLQACDQCHQTTDTHACSGCHAAEYCSGECQKKDWKGQHQVVCKALQTLRKQSAQLGVRSQIFLDAERSKVEIKEAGPLGLGIFATKKINPRDVIAFYYGDHREWKPLTRTQFRHDPTYIQCLPGGEIDGRHDLQWRSKAYLGAAFANDGWISPEDGKTLLTTDPLGNGELSPERTDTIATILADYAIKEAASNSFSGKAFATSGANAILNNWTITAMQSIAVGEEILVQYGPIYWLKRVTDLLAMRGYPQAELQLKFQVVQKLRQKLKNQQPVLHAIQERFDVSWIDETFLSQYAQTFQLPGCVGTILNFQGIFQGATSSVESVLYSKKDEPEFIGTVHGLIAQFRHRQPALSLEELISTARYSVSTPHECTVMQALVDQVRARPMSEFLNAQGGMRPHPLVLEFLENEGKDHTHWISMPQASDEDQNQPLVRLLQREHFIEQ